MKKKYINGMFYLLTIILLIIFSSFIHVTSQVYIEKSGFNLPNTEIESTDTVIWTNNDTRTHHIVGDDGSFESGDLGPAQNYSYKFTSVGIYKYHDAMDPSLNGSIRVYYPLMQ